MPASDQGVTHDRFMLIPRTLVFLQRGGTVLLLKGAPHKRLWANRYNGVGGHIERGEDVLSAAQRELAEETGLTCQALHLCGVVTVDAGQPVGIGIFVFTGQCPQGEPTASSEGTLEWVPRAALEGLPLVEDLPTLLPRVLAWQPGSPPFFAQYAYSAEGKLIITFSSMPFGSQL